MLLRVTSRRLRYTTAPSSRSSAPSSDDSGRVGHLEGVPEKWVTCLLLLSPPKSASVVAVQVAPGRFSICREQAGTPLGALVRAVARSRAGRNERALRRDAPDFNRRFGCVRSFAVSRNVCCPRPNRVRLRRIDGGELHRTLLPSSDHSSLTLGWASLPARRRRGGRRSGSSRSR